MSRAAVTNFRTRSELFLWNWISPWGRGTRAEDLRHSDSRNQLLVDGAGQELKSSGKARQEMFVWWFTFVVVLFCFSYVCFIFFYSYYCTDKCLFVQDIHAHLWQPAESLQFPQSWSYSLLDCRLPGLVLAIANMPGIHWMPALCTSASEISLLR